MQRDNKGNEKFAAPNPARSIKGAHGRFEGGQNDMYTKAYQALERLYEPTRSAPIRQTKGRQYLSSLTNLNFNGI